MAREIGRTQENLGRLRELLRGRHRLVIVGHDNPDPDFLGSALALRFLARELTGVPSLIACGGVLGRAENRAMARLLRIRITPLTPALFGRHTAVAVLDTQPGTGNNSLPRGVYPLVIIDHHPRRATTAADLIDIRADYGATSSILVEYLKALGPEVPAPLATALTYGILSETLDLSREAGEREVEAYLWLLVRANKRHLAQIIHPKVSRYYFITVGRALNNAFFYRNVIGARLGEVSLADVIAQTADLLLTHERMSWAICTGFVGDQLLVSARSTNGKANLGRLMRTLVARKGTAGGHELTAGAQIDCRDLLPAERLRLEEGLMTDFFRLVTHQKTIEPKPLIPRA